MDQACKVHDGISPGETGALGKFVLIDHSIRSFAGHHYEYALSVLDAAARAGYSPVLAAHRELPREALESLPYPVLPLYRYDFWGISGGLVAGRAGFRRLSTFVGGRTTRLKARLVFSRAGFLWVMFARRPQPLSAGGLAGTHGWPRSETFMGHCFGAAARAALFVLVTVRLLSRTLPARLVAAGQRRVIRLRGAVAARAWQAVESLLRQWRVHCFAADTGRVAHRISLEEGDLVFLPTVSESDLSGLGRYLRRSRVATRASWHLLFRRDIYRGHEARYEEQEISLASLRESFRAFRQNAGHLAVFFYTDTERLTAQYNRLGVATFRTLPIPVSPHFRLPVAATGRDRAIRLTYAGDARTEKGYHLLPDLVRDVKSFRSCGNAVRFVFQSNFTFRVPEHQARVVVARQFLQSFPADVVETIPTALTPEEYRSLVLSAGIMLLLYDRENYYARSSGLLAEALSAGIPVLVPAASWLSDQLEPAIFDYHLGLRATEPSWTACPGTDLAWVTLPLRAVLRPPRTAGYLLVTFRPVLAPGPGGPAYVLVRAWPEGLGQRESRCLVGLRGDGQPSTALLPLETGFSQVALELSNGLDERRLEVRDLEVAALLVEPGSLPLAAVGCACADFAHAAFLLGDMIRHYGHYRETAATFARSWVRDHCPDQLVAGLKAGGVDGR